MADAYTTYQYIATNMKIFIGKMLVSLAPNEYTESEGENGKATKWIEKSNAAKPLAPSIILGVVVTDNASTIGADYKWPDGEKSIVCYLHIVSPSVPLTKDNHTDLAFDLPIHIEGNKFPAYLSKDDLPSEILIKAVSRMIHWYSIINMLFDSFPRWAHTINVTKDTPDVDYTFTINSTYIGYTARNITITSKDPSVSGISVTMGAGSTTTTTVDKLKDTLTAYYATNLIGKVSAQYEVQHQRIIALLAHDASMQ